MGRWAWSQGLDTGCWRFKYSLKMVVEEWGDGVDEQEGNMGYVQMNGWREVTW